MPELSLFYGIRITLNYNDHNPPHFHAEYVGHNAQINILDATVLKGSLPKRQLKMVLAWAELHRDDLIQNWELSKSKQELVKIEPLR
jgi:hypothetical protein